MDARGHIAWLAIAAAACANGAGDSEETSPGGGHGGEDGGTVTASTAGPGGADGGSECVPELEICNGVDDDCDAAVDEDFGVGTWCDGPDLDGCPEGTTTCEGCTDTTGEASEIICNEMDDDCDGQTDEETTCLGCCDGPDADSCDDDSGTCTPFGLQCADAGGSIGETCSNGVDDDCDGSTDEIVAEACNGADDNCDGEVDEGCNCGPEIICNSLDDDCDGLADEESSCIGCCDSGDSDACADDDGTCTLFGVTCSDSNGSIPELCSNGLDDDCDGSVDEIVAEACNGADDDCDGIVDEGCNCVPEIICNGVDDDCDGVADEIQSCIGCCDSFSDTDLCPDDDGFCTPFGVSCNDAGGSIAEVCDDGIDDDCDGVVDDGC